MSKSKHITLQNKEMISYLYNNSRCSIKEIADALGISVRSIQRYKNYNIKFRSSKKVKTRSTDIDKRGKCTSCGSSNIIKAGHRGMKQRWHCKDCGYRFVYDPILPESTIGSKISKEIITDHGRETSKIELNEQDLFQKIYDLYRKDRYLMDQHWIYKWIKKNFKPKLSKLSRYQGKSTIEMINNVIEILGLNIQKRNEKIDLDIEMS